MNTPCPTTDRENTEIKEKKPKRSLYLGLALSFALLLGLLLFGRIIFYSPTTAPRITETVTVPEAAPASNYDLSTLQGRIDDYLQGEELASLAETQVSRVQDLYVKHSRELIKHNDDIDSQIEATNRSAISNMIRETEQSYPKLISKMQEEIENQKHADIQERATYQEHYDNLLSNYPAQNEEERAQLPALQEAWFEKHEDMLNPSIYEEMESRLNTDITEAMRARLKRCHHYVGRYMGG